MRTKKLKLKMSKRTHHPKKSSSKLVTNITGLERLFYNSFVRPLDLHNQLSDKLEKLDDVKFARYETDRIIEHVMGMPIGEYWASTDISLSTTMTSEIDRIVEDRLKGTPLAYSLGYVYFNGIRVELNPGVLIPRQETEGLSIIGRDIVRKHIKTDEPRLLDFGTGSGCIAVWLALELPFSIVWATDISTRAIETANSNIKKYGLTMRVVTLRYDGLEGIVGPSNLDLVISNPPYIAEDDGRLDESVRLYEPREALIATSEGLHYYRHIARWAPELLAKTGYVAVEVGEGQANTVSRIFLASGAESTEVARDIANIERYVIARYEN